MVSSVIFTVAIGINAIQERRKAGYRLYAAEYKVY